MRVWEQAVGTFNSMFFKGFSVDSSTYAGYCCSAPIKQAFDARRYRIPTSFMHFIADKRYDIVHNR